MGKPSRSHLSKKSDTSIRSSNSKLNMSGSLSLPKFIHNRKKKKNKTKKKIKKLLNTLQILQARRFETIISRVSDIPLPPTMPPEERIPIIKTINSNVPNNTENLIIIPDDQEDTSAKTPTKISRIKCSTPIAGHQNEHSFNNNSNVLQNKNTHVNSTMKTEEDSYITIDLTGDNDFNQTLKTNDTVINLSNVSENEECTLVNVSNTSIITCSDSDVTVVHGPSDMLARRMKQFTKGIAELNESGKGRLLEFIAEKIFIGCTMPRRIEKSLTNISDSISRATETLEDIYIKEVILGEVPSRSSVGSNIYHPRTDNRPQSDLRMIVIDGSNVAMEHTKGKQFSVKGLKICIDYFLQRGHIVKAFVPRFRCKFGYSTDPRLLDEMERRGHVIYTPSREIEGRTVTPYDDRYIIQCAAEFDGVIVTGDNYRDLANENPKWTFFINNRILPFTWVDDMIMFPKDPLGRNGPSLDQFLRYTPVNNQMVNFQINNF